MQFATYLLKSNLISKEQLKKVLILQFTRSTSLVEVLLNSSFCNLENFLISLDLFEKNKLDLLETLETNNFLSLESKDKILSQYKESLIPLWTLLVQDEICNYHQARSWYENYLKELEDLQKQKKTNETSTIQESHKSSKISSKEDTHQGMLNPSQTPIPNIEIKILDALMLSELLEAFDETKRSEIEQTIINFSKNSDVEILRSLYRELHTLKGTSRFIKANASEYLIHQLESLVQESIRYFNLMNDSLKLKVEEDLLLGLDLIWDLRTDIQLHDHEKCWLDKNWQKKVFILIENILSTSGKVQKLSEQLSIDKIDDMF